MTMNLKTGISMAMLSIAVLGVRAFAQDVRYNYDTEADFTTYKTYMWVDIPGGEEVDSLTEKQIKTAIEEALATKGLSKVEGGSADLAVAYDVAISQEKRLTMTGTGYGLSPRWGGMGTIYGNTASIPIGAVTLSMFDTGTKQLVWRGVATKQINTGVKPEKREQNLKKGAAKLLKNFPPKKKS